MLYIVHTLKTNLFGMRPPLWLCLLNFPRLHGKERPLRVAVDVVGWELLSLGVGLRSRFAGCPVFARTDFQKMPVRGILFLPKTASWRGTRTYSVSH